MTTSGTENRSDDVKPQQAPRPVIPAVTGRLLPQDLADVAQISLAT